MAVLCWISVLLESQCQGLKSVEREMEEAFKKGLNDTGATITINLCVTSFILVDTMATILKEAL